MAGGLSPLILVIVVAGVMVRERQRASAGQAGRAPKRIHKKPRRETLELLAANVRALRRAAKLSQDDFAHEAGLYRSYIGDIERCKHNPRLSTLEALADALRVRTADLLVPAARPKRGPVR